MQDSHIKLLLLEGSPIQLDGGSAFHIPTMRNIATLGEERYNKLISSWLINQRLLPRDRELPQHSNLELAYLNCLYNKQFYEDFVEAAKLFFKDEIKLSPLDLGIFFYFGELESKNIINSETFDFIQSLVLISNYISFDEDDYNPANEQAQKLAEELKKIKLEVAKRKEQQTDLESKISGLAWHASNGINIFNVFDLNVYQFYDALLRIEQIDNYRFTLSGIYTGNINSKKIKISDIHWTRKMK